MFVKGTDSLQADWTNTTFPMKATTDWIYPIGKILQLILTNFILLNILIALFKYVKKYNSTSLKSVSQSSAHACITVTGLYVPLFESISW